ncbi:MAG: hypothetical protein ACHQJ6_04425 [Candidatus Berkiellales bacterium]
MRLLKAVELNLVSGGATADQILEKGFLYGGSIGMMGGVGVSIIYCFTADYSGPIIPLLASFSFTMSGFIVGILMGTMVAFPVAAVYGTSNPTAAQILIKPLEEKK